LRSVRVAKIEARCRVPTGRMGELSLSSKAQEFMRVLRLHSSDQNDPVSEWDYVQHAVVEMAGEADGYRCICTTPIFLLHYIRNRISGKQLRIGCECIKRWDLGPRCSKCKLVVLGSIAKRKKENNWLCRSCNAIKKEIDKQELLEQLIEQGKAERRARDEKLAKAIEDHKLAAREAIGNEIFYGFGPWYGKKFSEVAMDSYVVEKILEREIPHPDYWAFRYYIR
jgi:hypothetical protein